MEHRLMDEFEGLLADGLVDFARLPRLLQRVVIERIGSDGRADDALKGANEWLVTLWDAGEPATAELVAANAEAVRANYSLESAGERLFRIYEEVTASTRSGRTVPPDNGAAILDSFLSLSRLHPIRVET